jgi:hypothetical protein
MTNNRIFPEHAFCVSSSCPACFPVRDTCLQYLKVNDTRHPGFSFDEDVQGSVIESRLRDIDWIRRELGDVPMAEVARSNTMLWTTTEGMDTIQVQDRPWEAWRDACGVRRATDGTLGRLVPVVYDPDSDVVMRD